MADNGAGVVAGKCSKTLAPAAAEVYAQKDTETERLINNKGFWAVQIIVPFAKAVNGAYVDSRDALGLLAQSDEIPPEQAHNDPMWLWIIKKYVIMK